MNDSRQETRRGVSMLIVVITLVVLTAVFGAMLQHILLANRQLKQEAHRLQALVLADSGIERAVQQLRLNPAYDGEVWKLTETELPGAPGEVTIELVAGEAVEQTIRVVAKFPLDSELGAVATKSVSVGPAKTNEQEGS